jgi:hypothetical protein
MTADERINARLKELRAKVQLPDWRTLTEDLKVPQALAAAFMTNRPELVKVVRAKHLMGADAVTEQNINALLKMIAVLLETNAALQSHAQELAVLMQDFHSLFKGLLHTAQRVEDFANFRTIGGEHDEQEG